MNTAPNPLQQAIKQAVREPLEILEDAGKQITGVEQSVEPGKPLPPVSTDAPRPVGQPDLAEQDRVRSAGRMKALENELRDIERQRVYNETQRRIQEGDEVPLIDITGLSYEQKEVLKAQMESIQARKDRANIPQAFIPQTAKPSRRFHFGKGPKVQAQREQTKTERPLPPSG